MKVFDTEQIARQKAPEEKKIRLRIRRPKDEKKPQQIVNTQKQKNSTRPKKAKFLSHSNQSFERETVASKVGKFKEAGEGSTRKNQPKSQPVKKQLKKIAKNSRFEKRLKVESLHFQTWRLSQ